MRILILTCNTGEGHNSCAKAIKEIFDLRGDDCRIEDSLRFISKTASKIISEGHVFIYRHLPGLFRWGYRFAENHPHMYRPGSAVNAFISSGSRKLAQYIDEEKYDAVLCVHVFAGIMLTAAKKQCKQAFRTAFVATDYTCSPTAEQSDLDTYFIPNMALQQEFISYGIPAEKLVASGIPVRQMLFTNEMKEQAKALMGVDPSHTHLVVMCGSMGCGPIHKIAADISGKLSGNEEMTIVCGTNRRLFRRLKRKFAGISGVHIQGYIENISRLMDSADIYLTKPGGISVTEAKTKALPMVFVNAVAGCEEYNRRFFINMGGAVTGESISDLADKCVLALRDNTQRDCMRAALKTIGQENAAEFICDYITAVPAEEK